MTPMRDAEMVGALAWSVVALSIGAISLLFLLIRAATKVSSLMSLAQPTTAAMAWALFGESFPALAVFGMLLAATGVALVIRPLAIPPLVIRR